MFLGTRGGKKGNQLNLLEVGQGDGPRDPKGGLYPKGGRICIFASDSD